MAFQALPYALALAVSAAPILAVVLIMITTRPPKVSAMFLAGWYLGILAVATVLVAFVDLSLRPRLHPVAAAIVRIVLGCVLAVLAVRSWRNRDSAESGSLARLSTWSATRALVVGLGLGALNPKNLAFVASGATVITAVSASVHHQVTSVVVFSLVASVGIAVPVLLRLFGGPATNRALQRAAAWMAARGALVAGVVLALLAAVLIAKGIAGLR